MSARWPDDLARLRDVVARELGLALDDDGKLPVLADLLARRAGAGPAAYLDRVEAHADAHERRALAAALTVGETYFFRVAEQFQALVERVLPERAAVRRPVQVLSAGCSSGEEPYSIAMAARDAGLADGDVAIRAVDVNPDALARAARARYTAWSMRETTPDALARWFRRDGAELAVADAIRTAVRFEERNLTVDDPDLWPADGYDVVFCRNVLMYFTPAHTQAAIDRLTRALAPGGYLFLGHAETLRGLSNAFHLCHTNGSFYYQRKAGPAARAAESRRGVRTTEPPRPTPAGAPLPGAWIDTIQDSADRVRALSERDPAAPRARTPAPAAGPAHAPALGRSLELIAHERYADALAGLDGAPRDRDVLLVRAALLAHGGRLADAERTCAELLALDELSAGAHYLLALCRDGAGDPGGAAEHDQVAAYLDPSFAMARLHLGLLARRAGDADGARRELGQAAVLLAREDASRLLLFGGGFAREALIAMCAEPAAARSSG